MFLSDSWDAVTARRAAEAPGAPSSDTWDRITERKAAEAPAAKPKWPVALLLVGVAMMAVSFYRPKGKQRG